MLQITDAHYGKTADIYVCDSCGFRQCFDLDTKLALYEDMDDASYEATRRERTLQARKLLAHISRFRSAGRLLDVGAGSGILVGEAMNRGFDAWGVEPSRHLQARAQQYGLRVVHGVLPHPEIAAPFDVVVAIDVIEHVADPVALLQGMAALLARGGVCAIVTPDVGSLAARVMGWRWWHYRMAHIGYFTHDTLKMAASLGGLEPVSITRPSWYFPASYVAVRGLSYLPKFMRPPVPRFLERVIVPINLYDSLFGIFRKPEANTYATAK
jgi:2-polyprenyl-3-methyl-5-hydroxy-6-metoxy-1,4-benzoquinol methylase